MVTIDARPRNKSAFETTPRSKKMPRTEQDEQRIREAAYDAWVRAGKPEGDGVEFWLEAERQLQLAEHASHDVVEEASEDSFPASDSPAWTPVMR
jgi:hypothetical protein